MVKIIEAIKGKLSTIESGAPTAGAPYIISNAKRADLVEFFKDMGYKKGAEIGVATAKFTEKLCQAGFEVYPIDPFKSYPDYTDLHIFNRMEKEMKTAQDRLKPYKCELILKTSMQAVDDFPDDSLDFVYIDGHHGFKYIAEDLCEWYKRVKVGGVVSGHDYIYINKKYNHPYVCHVKHVLPAFMNAYRIKKWYVLGRKDDPAGEKRDTFRSWFFIK